MSHIAWTEASIPSQAGRTVVITGGAGGIGFETARALARAGARVLLGCRDVDRARDAAARIRVDGAGGVEVVRLDLASLESVAAAADEIRNRCDRIDVLINNAGVMEPPYERTRDGFELTFATNHLGHFALTSALLPPLLVAAAARVFTVSSEGHERGEMCFDDLQSERGYDPDRAYSQSKLANLLFAYELERRLRASGARAISLACHPGIAATGLYRTRSWLERLLLHAPLGPLTSRFVQDAAMGALPSLRAATDPDARGGEFYGPPGAGRTGHPVPVRSSDPSYDPALQARLWRESERLTGVAFPV